MACITWDLAKEHRERIKSFREELERVARAMGKTGEWVRQKVRFMELVWRDADGEVIRKRVEGGRFCWAVYVDEDWEELVREVVRERGCLERRTQAELVDVVDEAEVEVESERRTDEPAKSKLLKMSPSLSPPRGSVSTSSSMKRSMLPTPRR